MFYLFTQDGDLTKTKYQIRSQTNSRIVLLGEDKSIVKMYHNGKFLLLLKEVQDSYSIMMKLDLKNKTKLKMKFIKQNYIVEYDLITSKLEVDFSKKIEFAYTLYSKGELVHSFNGAYKLIKE